MCTKVERERREIGRQIGREGEGGRKEGMVEGKGGRERY